MKHSIELEQRSGLLVARCSGFWTLEEAQLYCAGIERWTNVIRSRGRSVSMLLDLRDHGVQSVEVMKALKPARDATFVTPDDRLALFLNAGLTRMQTRRLISSVQTRVFANEAEAREWLAAERRAALVPARATTERAVAGRAG